MSKTGQLPAAPVPPGLREKGERLDIHAMFRSFNELYFGSSLDGVYVEYSPKMTLCAGTCTFHGPSGGCRIGLSEPLLLRRPPSDTRDTLLHECIHASLFLKHGVQRDGPDGHGPMFLREAARVNAAAGSSITVYHNFMDEVEAHRTHWWRCGSCGKVVKRAMNRKPSPLDTWWPEHERQCGGVFEKTHEPPPKSPPPKRPRFGAVAVYAHGGKPANPATHSGKGSPMRTRRIDEMLDRGEAASRPSKERCVLRGGSKLGSISKRGGFGFACPVCQARFSSEGAVSSHLDQCLTGSNVPQEHGKATSSRDLPGVASRSRWSRFVEEEDDDIVFTGSGEDGNDSPPSPGKRLRDVGPSDGGVVQDVAEPVTSERMLEPRQDVGTEGQGYGLGLGDNLCGKFPVPPSETSSHFQSTEFLDFALGIGGPFAPPQCVAAAGDSRLRGFRSKDLTKLPGLPLQKNVLCTPEALRRLAKELNLWNPNGDKDEAPFASSAARQGLTPAAFMSLLVGESKRDGISLVLSDEARNLFIRKPENPKGARRSAWPGSLDTGHKVVQSREKRVRSTEREVIPVDSNSRSPGVKSSPSERNAIPAERRANVTVPVPDPQPPQRLPKPRHIGTSQRTASGGIEKYFTPFTAGTREPRGQLGKTRPEPRRLQDPLSDGDVVFLDVDGSETTKTCSLCRQNFSTASFDSHWKMCTQAKKSSGAVSDHDTTSREAATERNGSDATLHVPGLAIGSTSGATVSDVTDCPMCGEKVARREIDNHLVACIGDSQSSQSLDCDVQDANTSVFGDCPICGDKVLMTDIERHKEQCMTAFAAGALC